GYDVAGEVVALGPHAAGTTVGERVFVHYDYSCGRCEFCLDGDESLCASYGCMGVDRDGGYAEFVTAPVRNLFALAPGTSFEAAAAVGSVYLTAFHMVFARGGLRAGETARDGRWLRRRRRRAPACSLGRSARARHRGDRAKAGAGGG